MFTLKQIWKIQLKYQRPVYQPCRSRVIHKCRLFYLNELQLMRFVHYNSCQNAPLNVNIIKTILICVYLHFSAERLRDFDVLLYNPSDASWDGYDQGTSTLCFHQSGVAPSILNVTCEGVNTRGRFVKIIMAKNNDVENHCLTLCEVEVYGGKTSGEFNNCSS